MRDVIHIPPSTLPSTLLKYNSLFKFSYIEHLHQTNTEYLNLHYIHQEVFCLYLQCMCTIKTIHNYMY